MPAFDSAFAEFESQMNRVRAVSGATGADFERLEKQARQLGSTTVFTATQVAQGQGFLARAGFEVNEIYGAIPATLDLAAAAQLDLASSADIVTNIMAGFKIETKDLREAVDVLTGTFTSSNTAERSIAALNLP